MAEEAEGAQMDKPEKIPGKKQVAENLVQEGPAQNEPSYCRAQELEAILHPFRLVASEQLPTSGLPGAAPTVITLPVETLSDSKQATGAERSGELKGAHSIVDPSEAKTSKFLPTAVSPATSTTVHIHAHTANVYNVASTACQRCTHERSAADTKESGSAGATTLLSRNNLASPPQGAMPLCDMHKPSSILDVPADEPHIFPSSPRVYPVPVKPKLPAFERALGNFPITQTEPPSFMNKEYLEAMRDTYSHMPSNYGDIYSTTGPGRKHADAEVLLSENPNICPQGKSDCPCAPQAIELFKNAAAYLYRHTRTLGQDLFQAHVHVGERIECLQQISALNGGPTLPGSVHEFLQTETSQLLQDWAIAESKCSQYICDCILADVNGFQVEEPSEGAAKSIPPHLIDTNESMTSAEPSDRRDEPSEGSSTAHQAQCSERFAELKKDLLILTERSKRIKKQWANLLDLCNKLEEVARVSRAAVPAELDGLENATEAEPTGNIYSREGDETFSRSV